MRFILIFFFIFITVELCSQNYYFVQFKNKSNSIGLSDEAIERRKKNNIKIDSTDYNVNQYYISYLAKDFKINIVTKWFNGIVLEASDIDLSKIENFDFVKSVKFISTKNYTNKNLKVNSNKKALSFDSLEYGKSWKQNSIHNIRALHDSGFLGNNIKIGVFDAGFNNLDKMSVFKHLFDENRIFEVENIVDGNKNLFSRDIHGTVVMGCMSSFLKDTIIGTAPKANYYLFITEDNSKENKIEEYNWLRAAEIADSMGIDIVNSSLGYSEFDDFNTNYTINDMDGKTTIISQAAQMLYNKGVLVVNSAGNMGDDKWRYITAPSDAPGVIAVGSIDTNKNISNFSSRGISSNFYLKPNVVAIGSNTVAYFDGNNYYISNGTSLSCPIITGLLACFMQKFPNITYDVLKNNFYKSCSHFNTFNHNIGYGYPVFNDKTIVNFDNGNLLLSNPIFNNSKIKFETSVESEVELKIYDQLKLVYNKNSISSKGENIIDIDFEKYSSGIYFILLKINGENFYFKSFVF